MNSDYHAQIAHLRELIEARLTSLFADEKAATSLVEAMRYSLLGGGKRIRPILALMFANACGTDVFAGSAARRGVLDAACALEMLHTYSLIHDDLPSMDDDDMRRGKPSNHVAFGEWCAILAGDALQAEAFGLIVRCGLPSERVVAMLSAFSDAAGIAGICGGQTLDIEGADEIMAIHERKTASLIIASALIGVLAAGGSAMQLAAAQKYAQSVGLAFQIRDDVLDATGDAVLLGKPVGSDERGGKTTFFTLHGAEKCDEIVASLTRDAQDAVRKAFADSDALCQLAAELAGREV